MAGKSNRGEAARERQDVRLGKEIVKAGQRLTAREQAEVREYEGRGGRGKKAQPKAGRARGR